MRVRGVVFGGVSGVVVRTFVGECLAGCYGDAAVGEA